MPDSSASATGRTSSAWWLIARPPRPPPPPWASTAAPGPPIPAGGTWWCPLLGPRPCPLGLCGARCASGGQDGAARLLVRGRRASAAAPPASVDATFDDRFLAVTQGSSSGLLAEGEHGTCNVPNGFCVRGRAFDPRHRRRAVTPVPRARFAPLRRRALRHLRQHYPATKAA